MSKKARLALLIDLFGELITKKENNWMVSELLNKIEQVSPDKKIVEYPVIQKINELCIEEVIAKQAREFYSNFPLEELKKELVDYFIEMEHAWRRNDFNTFSLRIYQQIEYILNTLFYNIQLRNKIATDYTKKINFYDVEKSRKGESQKRSFKDLFVEILYPAKEHDIPRYFGKNNDPISGMQGWSFMQKYKAILYYYNFKEESIPFKLWAHLTRRAYELHVVRNLIHKGSGQTKRQKELTETINKDPIIYALRFYGLLGEFIIGINEGYRPQIS